MRFLLIFLIIPLIQGCLPEQPKPSIQVEKELFNNKNWNLAVLDLKYVEQQGEARSGVVVANSAGADAGQVIASLLSNELAKLDNIQIVERGQIDNLLNEQKLQLSGVVNTATAVEIGQMLGANAVLIGNVSDYLSWSSLGLPGSTVAFSMRIINVKTGQVLTSGSITRIANFTTAFQNALNLSGELVAQISQSTQ